jgi:hypothetical protein
MKRPAFPSDRIVGVHRVAVAELRMQADACEPRNAHRTAGEIGRPQGQPRIIAVVRLVARSLLDDEAGASLTAHDD